MTLGETLDKLKAFGNEKVRKQNAKNGAHENQFGVKLGDIRAIAKTIKTDHELAKALWDTGNIDARFLAILILDIKALSADDIDAMIRSVNFIYVADWLSAYVIKQHPNHEVLRERWMSTDHLMAARAGWSLTSGRVARNPDGLNIQALLNRIEAEMPNATLEVQWTMNTTLAQIGIHHPEYRDRALAMGEKMGIYRDYPVSKGCTSPFAPIWINEIVSRQG